MSTVEAPFPHCDSLVLHAPGRCKYCDMYPDMQSKRIRERIDFTDQHVTGNSRCPSELRRPVEQIERWPGNWPIADIANRALAEDD
jgi:hypothetical protein